MTREEFAQVAAGLRAVYKRDGFLATKEAMEIWYTLLQDLPGEEVSVAVQKYMLTSRYTPTIADIRELCSPPKSDWGEGWAKVKAAFSKYGTYDIEGAMQSFDEVTRATVKRLGGFRALCESENEMADRANFRTIYESVSIKHHEQQLLPDRLKQNYLDTVTKSLTGKAE